MKSTPIAPCPVKSNLVSPNRITVYIGCSLWFDTIGLDGKLVGGGGGVPISIRGPFGTAGMVGRGIYKSTFCGSVGFLSHADAGPVNGILPEANRSSTTVGKIGEGVSSSSAIC